MIHKTVLIFLFLNVFVLTMFSQQGSSYDELKTIKRVTGLTVKHKFLDIFSGKWKIKGMNYTGIAPEAVIGNATVESILGGHYLEINMELTQSLGSSHSRIIIGFDTRISKFSFFSIDDYANFGLNCNGIKDDNKLIFEGKDYSLFYKKDLSFKIVIERERVNKFSYKVYYNFKDKNKLMIEYYFFKQQ